MSQFDAEPMDLAPPSSRTSVLAVSSLVLSLICCIPGLGAIGTLLGVGAMVGISRSQGRVRGMGLAVAGIVLGVLFSLAWIAILIAVTMGLQSISKYSEALDAIQAGDRQALTSWMSPGVQASVTDDKVAAFRDAYRADYGEYVGVPNSIGGMLRGYMAVGQQIQPAQIAAESDGYSRNEAFPLAVTFDSGPGIVLVALDPNSKSPSGAPAALNIAYVRPDGSLVWLLEPPSGP